MSLRNTLSIAAILFNSLVACSGSPTDTDAGQDVTMGSDVVQDTPRADTARADTARNDSGPADPCATDQPTANSTVGCNGGFMATDPAPNAVGGACTADDAGTGGPGSCTASGNECGLGVCLQNCRAGTTYVSTGDCPTGFRCFDLGANGAFCFRDCDATHACPTGQMCDGEGSCYFM